MPAGLGRSCRSPNGVADAVTTEPRSEPRRVTPDLFPACYALLQATFHAEELNTKQQMLADLTTPADGRPAEEFVMLARRAEAEGRGRQGNAVISLIVGCYLGLSAPEFAGQSAGFIEYLVTSAAFRQQGHASAMLAAFEQEMHRIAQARQERLRLIVGEIEADLVAFKRKRGYRQPAGCRYAQPPIAFDELTGAPLADALPKVLVVNAGNDPVEARLLLDAVRQIFAKRYVPRRASEPAARHAAAFIHSQVYAPFAASLQTADGIVRLD